MKSGMTTAESIVCLILIPISCTWGGYVLSVLWSWFIVVGFGAAAISVPLAIGTMLVVNMFTLGLAKTSRTFGEYVSLAFIEPVVILFMGWIVTKFL